MGPGASLPLRCLPSHPRPCGRLWPLSAAAPSALGAPRAGGTSSAPSTRHEGCQPLAPRAEGFMLFPTRLWQPEPPSPSPVPLAGEQALLSQDAPAPLLGLAEKHQEFTEPGSGGQMIPGGMGEGGMEKLHSQTHPRGVYSSHSTVMCSWLLLWVGLKRPRGRQIPCALCVPPSSQP